MVYLGKSTPYQPRRPFMAFCARFFQSMTNAAAAMTAPKTTTTPSTEPSMIHLVLHDDESVVNRTTRVCFVELESIFDLTFLHPLIGCLTLTPSPSREFGQSAF